MNSELPVIQLGTPSLREISTPIPDEQFGTAELLELSTTLFHLMDVHHGLGLAAPQVGINKRAVVFGMEEHPVKKHLSSIPYTILFNPSFEPLSNSIEEQYEGCLSVGELRGKVPRFTQIIYRGYNVEGELVEREVSGLHARVVQHEIDHLDGIIFIDKVKDHLSLGFHAELVKAGVFN